MLEYLYIENVALIEKIEIVFNYGLNILSGETGAGKSIIIDSINFVLGERAGKDFIHRGAEKATVEVLITVNNNSVIDEIESMGIEVDEENSILISRTINLNGKTNNRINGKNVTIGMLKEISSILIDIHGQNEHQSLFNPNKHIDMLDRFCGEKINSLKLNLAEEYKKYREILNSIDSIDGDSEKRQSKIDLYEYQIKEIDDAHLKIGEEEELIEKRKMMNSTEKLKSLTNAALEFLYRSEEMAAVDRISSALNNLYDIYMIDSSQKKVYEDLESIYAQLEDVVTNIRHYNDNIEYEPHIIDEIENRLDLIYNLKRKYGSTLEEILKYYDTVSEKLKMILNSEHELIKLTDKKNKAEENIKKICSEISIERIKYGEKIQKHIERILNELGMKNALFSINITKKENFSSNGWDKVEFLISPNKGENLKPLAEIASGGEMSRVMLALKTVLAAVDNIETFIFDEIDTGISGRTAQQVAEKLAVIGKSHQILCITHLPQIAAMGDKHYLIEKSTVENSTTTSVIELNYEDTICELARLIGGAQITQSTMNAAKEMKELAEKLKCIC